jgi:hypothetical protein
VVTQWTWNLCLELGHHLHPDPIRTTEFSPALPPSSHTTPPSGYAPPQVGLPWKDGRFSGQDFALQPDGTLRCQARQQLIPQEQPRRSQWEPAHGAWSQYPQLSSLSAARAVPVAGQHRQEAASGQREVRIPWVSVLSRFSGRTGVDGSTAGRVCTSCVPNGWRCKGKRAALPIEIARLCLCPELRVHTLGSPGQSGWLAMHAPARRAS